MNINELEDFIKKSPVSIVMDGCYNIGLDVLIKSFEEYIKTGYNPIKEHQSLTFIKWYAHDECYDISDDELELIYRCINDKTFWSWSVFFDKKEDLEELFFTARAIKKNSQSYRERRKKANRNNSKKTVRQQVFSRDGYQCKVCNSTSNLSIDHVIPVVKGGGNDINNLQTLCKPCNSSKGGK